MHFFFVLIGLVLLGLGGGVAVMAFATRRELRELTTRVHGLEARFEARPPELSAAAGNPASSDDAAASPAAGTSAPSRPSFLPPPVPILPTSPDVTPVPALPPPLPSGPAWPLPEPSVAFEPAAEAVAETPLPLSPPPERAINWEQFMGVKLFAWIGGLALFLGVAFFIKYSFEHDLIPAWLRVASGFATGLALIGGGAWLNRRERTVPAQTLCGTGVVILYAAAFACRGVYHFPLFTQFNTFLLMAAITAGAFLLAVRLEAMVIAVLGMLGGFLTPYLLRSGEERTLLLFTYIALLDLGLVAVAARRRWPVLTALGALGTIITQLSWCAEFFAPARIWTASAIFGGFDLLFLAAFAFAQWRRSVDHWTIGAAAMMPMVTLCFAWSLAGNRTLPNAPFSLFALVLTADLVLLALAWLRERLRAAHLIAGGFAVAIVATWMAIQLTDALLPWALGLTTVVALLHTAFPLWLERRYPNAKPHNAAFLFPALGLLLLALPLIQLPGASWLMWPVVLLLDVAALLLAALTASLFGVVAALVLTLLLAVGLVLKLPANLDDLPGLLAVVGGFGALFCVAALFGWLKRPGRLGELKSEPDNSLNALGTGAVSQAELLRQLPAFSATLPFLLLVLIVARLPLANPSAVFGLGLAFAAGLLALTRPLRLPWLPAVALGATALLEAAWHGNHFDLTQPWLAVGWYLLFFVVFGGFPFVWRKTFRDESVPWVSAALSGPIHFALVYDAIRRAYPDFGALGLVPFAFALPLLAATWCVWRELPNEHPQRLSRLAWFAGVALLFLTLIFPIQFKRQWLTIGWALEGVALIALFRRLPHPGLRATGLALLVAAFARLALNPAVYFTPYAPTGNKILNWYLYTYGLVIVCLLTAQWLLAPPRHQVGRANVRPILGGLAGVLVFLLINIEIADYFSTGPQLTFEFSGNFARDLSYTVAWALFAFGLMFLGILKDLRLTRYAGVGLLSVTLLKLFLHDLARLDQLYRIGALVIVAIIAILASFLYQRYFRRGGRGELTLLVAASRESAG